ncbi:hypothetical protein, partial [Streptomyces sp. NPDC019539]|uniref:hypothetical protein n=1 Tax=Streptomyces sp. NPDC019539 TaxID=3365063 RepID=UPI0037908F07
GSQGAQGGGAQLQTVQAQVDISQQAVATVNCPPAAPIVVSGGFQWSGTAGLTPNINRPLPNNSGWQAGVSAFAPDQGGILTVFARCTS